MTSTTLAGERVIRPRQLAQMLSVHRVTLYTWIRDGILPKPIRFGARSVGWRASTIDAWLAKRAQEGAV
jgi:prophage regulatory protein